jgi:hypothetical protein
MIAVGAKRVKPVRSRDLRVVLRVDFTVIWAVWLGMWMKKRKRATSPPAGRLM